MRFKKYKESMCLIELIQTLKQENQKLKEDNNTLQQRINTLEEQLMRHEAKS